MPRAMRPGPPSFSLAKMKIVSPAAMLLAAIHRLLRGERERLCVRLGHLCLDRKHPAALIHAALFMRCLLRRSYFCEIASAAASASASVLYR